MLAKFGIFKFYDQKFPYREF